MIVSVQVADYVGVRSDEFSFATCPMIGYGAVLGATPSHGAFLCVFSHFEKGGSSILYDYTFPFVDEMGHFKRLQNMLILIAYKQCKNISLVSFYSRFSRQFIIELPLLYWDHDCAGVWLEWPPHLAWLQKLYNWRIFSWSISSAACFSHPAGDWCNRSPNHRLTLGRVYPCGWRCEYQPLHHQHHPYQQSQS